MSLNLNKLFQLPSLPNPFGNHAANAYARGFADGASVQALVGQNGRDSWDDRRCGSERENDRGYGGFGGRHGGDGGYGNYGNYGNYGGYGHHGRGGHHGGGHHHGREGGYGQDQDRSGSWGSHFRQDHQSSGYENCGYGSHASQGHGAYGHGSHGAGGVGGGSVTQPRGDLRASKVGSDVQVQTAGNYKISFSSADENTGGKMKIISPNGAETVMEGDPHAWVDKDGNGPGGSKLAFDYKGNLTLTLADGSKIDIDTKALSNGTTVLDRATVVPKYGSNGVVVSGLSSGTDMLTMETGIKQKIDPLISGTAINWDAGGSGDYTYNNDYGGLSPLTQSWINSHETV